MLDRRQPRRAATGLEPRRLALAEQGKLLLNKALSLAQPAWHDKVVGSIHVVSLADVDLAQDAKPAWVVFVQLCQLSYCQELATLEPSSLQ